MNKQIPNVLPDFNQSEASLCGDLPMLLNHAFSTGLFKTSVRVIMHCALTFVLVEFVF